jgi:hypothetical protein
MSEASSLLKEDARSGGQQEERPGPHDEDAAAEGEDFLVQPARPGLLPALEVRREALAGRGRGELLPALLEGVEHGPGLQRVGNKIANQAWSVSRFQSRGARVRPATRSGRTPGPGRGLGPVHK